MRHSRRAEMGYVYSPQQTMADQERLSAMSKQLTSMILASLDNHIQLNRQRTAERYSLIRTYGRC